MIIRNIKAALIPAILAGIVQPAPDLKRYLELREPRRRTGGDALAGRRRPPVRR